MVVDATKNKNYSLGIQCGDYEKFLELRNLMIRAQAHMTLIYKDRVRMREVLVHSLTLLLKEPLPNDS